MLPAGAQASQLIARDAKDVTLRVNARGQALVGYRAKGKRWTVLARGAINARHPAPGPAAGRLPGRLLGRVGHVPQDPLARVRQRVPAVRGPPLAWFVTGCTMPDGSHWALQAWQRGLPNLGLDPWKPLQASWELRLSHWNGELPKLEIWTNWAYSKRFDHLFGRLTYLGQPVVRLPVVVEGGAGGQLRPQRLRRHLQLGLRPGLEAREQLPLAPRHGGVLLRPLPARPVSRLPGRRAPSRREGRALPRDRRRPGSPPGRDLGGRRAGRVRRGARPAARRRTTRRCTAPTPSASPSDPRTIGRVPAAGPIDAVVFDMDGVLVDTEHLWDEVREALTEEWGGRYTPEAQEAMMGMSSPRVVALPPRGRRAPRAAGGDQRGGRAADARPLRDRPAGRAGRRRGGASGWRTAGLRLARRVVLEPRADRRGAAAARADVGLRGHGLVRGGARGASRRPTSTSRPRGAWASLRRGASRSRTRRAGSARRTQQGCA